MTTHLETRLKIESFDEPPYREFDDGAKLTRGTLSMTVAEEAIEAEVAWDALSFFAADGKASYVGLMYVAGRIGERSGGVVLRGSGDYDGTRARIDLTVLPGSGTGELAGMRGTATSVSTHEDYPYMPLAFDYDIDANIDADIDE
jgi:hypothetical protein